MSIMGSRRVREGTEAADTAGHILRTPTVRRISPNEVRLFSIDYLYACPGGKAAFDFQRDSAMFNLREYVSPRRCGRTGATQWTLSTQRTTRRTTGERD